MNNLEAIKTIDANFLNYQVQYGPLGAEDVIHALHPEGNAMRVLVESINALVPPMDYGPHNPNTGAPHHDLIIGRESSRVIYLRILRTYMPKTFDYQDFEKQLRYIAVSAGADEFKFTIDQSEVIVRIWWD